MFTLDEVAHATGGTVQGAAPQHLRLQAAVTDSRSLQPGQLFVPLRGARFDGHEFLGQAVARGAAAVLADHPVEVAVPCVIVENTLKAYQALARHHRLRMAQARVFAVTGSNGKTLTKDLLAHLLSQILRVIKTPANLNNEIGLPQTLFLMDETTQAAVVEMGMRGLGQIEELALVAVPDVGIITTVGEAHLELLGSREAIADAKGELIEHLAPGGTAILPRDNPYYERLRSKARGPVLTFGAHPEADVRMLDFEPLGWEGSRVTVAWPGGTFTVRYPLLGRHLADNLLAAVASIHAAGLDVKKAVASLDSFVPSGQRLEPVKAACGAAVINDAYNASPTSVRGALQLLPFLPCRGRRIAVLGDMLELGPIEEAAHRDVGREAACAGVDVLVAVGLRSKAMADAFMAETGGQRPVFLAADAAQASQQVLHLVHPEDLVLVKASHSIGLEAVVAALQANS